MGYQERRDKALQIINTSQDDDKKAASSKSNYNPAVVDMLRKIEEETVQDLIDDGMSEDKARVLAKQAMAPAYKKAGVILNQKEDKTKSETKREKIELMSEMDSKKSLRAEVYGLGQDRQDASLAERKKLNVDETEMASEELDEPTEIEKKKSYLEKAKELAREAKFLEANITTAMKMESEPELWEGSVGKAMRETLEFDKGKLMGTTEVDPFDENAELDDEQVKLDNFNTMIAGENAASDAELEGYNTKLEGYEGADDINGIISDSSSIKHVSNKASDINAAGNIVGSLGTLVGSFGQLSNTLVNRAGDQPYRNWFKGYGNRTLGKLDEMKSFAREALGEGYEDILLTENTARKRNRNLARGIGELMAMEQGTHMATQDAKGKERLKYSSTIANIDKDMANVMLDQDKVIMSGDERADLQDRQQRDQFFSNLGSDIGTMGEGLQSLGKNMNTTQLSNDQLDIINQATEGFEWEMGPNGLKLVTK